MIEWFEVDNTFDVGPAAAGSARLLENPLNGPVMRITQTRGSWKVLAFPGTGYDVLVDHEMVNSGSPRTVIYGSSIQILRRGSVIFEATFEDTDELERRVTALVQDCHAAEDQLVVRDRQLEATRGELSQLQRRLAATEAQRDWLEQISPGQKRLAQEHEQLQDEYARLNMAYERLRKERDELKFNDEQQNIKLQQLGDKCRGLEQLYRLTQDNATAQVDYYRQKFNEIQQQYIESQRERDNIMAMYHQCVQAMSDRERDS